MLVRIDEAKLTEYLNSRVDIPYLPESAEALIFAEALAAGSSALCEIVKKLPDTVDFITIEA